jgi:hypothetical protein
MLNVRESLLLSWHSDGMPQPAREGFKIYHFYSNRVLVGKEVLSVIEFLL